MGEPLDPRRDATGRRRAPLWIVAGAALVLVVFALALPALRRPLPPPVPQVPAPAPLAADAAAVASATIRELVSAASHPSLRHPAFPHYREEMEDLYGPAGFAPLWFEGARPRDQARDVIDVLKEADTRGLPPETADVGLLEAWWVAAQVPPGLDPRELGLFDAALSLLYIRHVSDVHLGRVKPRNLPIDFDVEPQKRPLSEIVRDVIARDRVRAAIEEAEPPFEQYRRLKAALPRFRALATDPSLSPLPEVKKLSPGDAYAGAPGLARLLVAFGDLPGDAAAPWIAQAGEALHYEGALVEAVTRFQERHGLVADGIIGRDTLARLNVPMNERVRLIELALERLRWLRPPPPGPVIIVNIAGFRLWAFDLPLRPGGQVLTMKVVVGRALRSETPVFGEQMKHLVFRPYWNIPPSILLDETLPAARRDPGYLDAQDLEILAGERDDSPVVPSTPENLEQAGRGAYRVRQRPGAKNALGRVKFMFPNNANVYMHDTPSQGVFARSRRDLSHGCVRVAEPGALAEWVLRGVPGWTRERVEQAMAAEAPQQVNLPRPVPVLLFYATTIADAAGRLAFFEDIYGHDRRLEETLRRGEPYAPRRTAAQEEARMPAR